MLDELLSPLLVGSVRLRNRIVSTAHQTTLVHDHLPTDDFVAYHEARARGGVGLIVLEATAVDPSGLLTPHTLAGYREESTAGFARVAEAVRPHGARLFVQLFHGGREQIASPPRTPAISASAIPSRRFHVEPRAATQADIESIVDGYARSAANVAAAGLDGIEISAAHNYLAAQFFTPGLNRRDDEWAEPGRFLLAVLEAVRRAAPGPCARRAAERGLGGRPERRRRAGEPRRLCQRRARRVLHVPGRHGHRAPAALPRERHRRLRRVPGRAAARGHVANRRPRRGRPARRRRRVRGGRDDARAHHRPRPPAQGGGRRARRGPAVHRLQRVHRPLPRRHADRLHAEPAHRARAHAAPAGAGRRSGGASSWSGPGPAGSPPRPRPARPGTRSSSWSARDRIGGQLALAGAAPMHEEARALARAQLRAPARRRRSRGAARHGGRRGHRRRARARPGRRRHGRTSVRPGPPAGGSRRRVQAWDVLAGPLPTGRRAVVADWGGDASGLASAELLARAGNDVVLAVGSATLGETLHQYQRSLYAQRLYRAGVEILHHLDLVAAELGAVRFRNLFAPDLETTLPVDLLVLALGTGARARPGRGADRPRPARRGGRRLPQPAQRGGGGPRRYPRGPPARRSLRSAR